MMDMGIHVGTEPDRDGGIPETIQTVAAKDLVYIHNETRVKTCIGLAAVRIGDRVMNPPRSGDEL